MSDELDFNFNEEECEEYDFTSLNDFYVSAKLHKLLQDKDYALAELYKIVPEDIYNIVSRIYDDYIQLVDGMAIKLQRLGVSLSNHKELVRSYKYEYKYLKRALKTVRKIEDVFCNKEITFSTAQLVVIEDIRQLYLTTINKMAEDFCADPGRYLQEAEEWMQEQAQAKKQIRKKK